MDRERVHKVASDVVNRVGNVVEELKKEHPGLRVHMAIEIEGVAALGVDFQSKSRDATTALDSETESGLQEQARIFRRIAAGVGHQLYQNPLDPKTAAAQRHYVSQVSRGFFERYLQHVAGKLEVPDGRELCSCGACRVQEAGTMIAAGVRLLDSLDVPRLALSELQEVARECCRRGHLIAIQREAIGDA